MLVARDLVCSAGSRRLVDGASLALVPGTVHAVLGPNGAGKSTLLRLLAGERAPDAGTVELDGRPLAAWPARDLARHRAVLPQHHGLAFGFTAAQVVALGRLAAARHSAAAEARLVREALALAGVAHLAERKYPTLSGGERARVQLARVVAQVWDAPGAGDRFLLLDEPTASLDFAHQHECLALARTLGARGIGVLVVLHDPNLALRYADVVILMREGRVLAAGTPATTITAENLERLYRVPVRLIPGAAGEHPVVVARSVMPDARARLAP